MSSRNKTKKRQVTNFETVGAKNVGNGTPVVNPAILQAYSLIQKKDYVGAANMLGSAGHDTQVRNVLGVCLMRLGRIDEAVKIYRSFVLQPGTVYERANVSGAAKRNFATALLLKGLPSGAVTVLDDMHDPEHPMAVRLYSALKRWEKSLSWFRWLDWKINAIHPANCNVPIDFEPGELDIQVPAQRPVGPSKPSTGPMKLAA